MSEPAGTDRVLTIPNLISSLRIALIPAFVVLIVDRDTTRAGLVLFVVVVATDWIDGALARATGQVSDLGKVLDPVADRLAIAAGLIALVVVDAFPLWAALLILVRDVAVLIAGLVLLSKRRARIEVRYLGKVATFALMAAIASIAWGTLGYP
ncbi:MAG TPA: CDP-alcohol phosphatidyltransferase family protein, partial [Actinomycetota bacterium]|nr:CDP-alcohol phosphatidyltransferase family protein [Actinomycetota bacterium]